MITCKCPYCGSEMFQVSDNIFACSKMECSVGHLSVPLQYVEDLHKYKQALDVARIQYLVITEHWLKALYYHQPQHIHDRIMEFMAHYDKRINEVLKRTNNDR